MQGYIDGIDFYNLEIQKYYAPPRSWSEEKIKNITTSRIFSGDWLGSRKRDGAYYLFVKDEDGNMFLRGRSKSVSGEYLDKIDWVPHLMPFFNELPNGTCLAGELYLKSNEQAKSTTTIMNCLVNKAVKRQEKEPLIYYVFDILADEGKSCLNMTATERFDLINSYWRAYSHEYVEFAQYYSGKELWEQLQSILAEGGEGVVITQQDSLYQPGKRPSKQCLKVKKELQETIDCFVIGALPPTKQYTGKEIEDWPYWLDDLRSEKINKKLYNEYAGGAAVVPVTKNWFYGWAGSLRLGVMKDGKEVEIGSISGITDEIKANWKDYIGHVCTITAMEVMDTGGIRHPKFCNWRDDITKEDCTWEKIYG